MHFKSSKVCNITRSPLASLLFKGLATKHTTVKWTIDREARKNAGDGLVLDEIQYSIDEGKSIPKFQSHMLKSYLLATNFFILNHELNYEKPNH